MTHNDSIKSKRQKLREQLIRIQDHDPIIKARNIGPIVSRELESLSVRTYGDLRKMGWQKTYALWVAAYPKRHHLMAAYALLGAFLHKDLLTLSQKEKEDCKLFHQSIMPKSS